MPVKIPLVGSGVARIPLTNLQKVPDIADPYFIGYRPKPIIAPAITHELVNLTSTVAHLYRIDLSRVVPFVTPFTGYKLTPSQFLDLYGMDFAINGDGGSWLFGLMQMLGLNRFDLLGSLVSAGRWMSNGKWISQVTSENSIWFESSGRCNIAYSKPVGLSPWNVISGPKQMINNSLQVRLYDDTFVAARSAFGVWNDNTHAVAIAIEGNEFTDFGATEQELAEFGVSLDLFQMMELDSGGSTSVAFKSGISYSVENRPVLNALCFKSRV